jgi:hypothetical protein
MARMSIALAAATGLALASGMVLADAPRQATGGRAVAADPRSPYYGRWTVGGAKEVFSARGKLYKTIDIAPCGRDFCGVSVAATLAVNLVGIGIVCWFTKNLAALDSFDFWLANFTPFVFALLQTIMIAWVWGADKMVAELKRGAKIQVPRALGFVVKYLSTPYLAIIFALWLWNNLGARLAGVAEDAAAQVSLAFIGCLTATLIVVSIKASRRWRREEKENAQTEQTQKISAAK